MNYGLTRMSQGRYAEAMSYFERALAKAPQYGYAHVNLAIALTAMGREAEAERHFREALEYQPNVPSLHLFYARWLDQAGRIDEAVRHLEKCVELAPADLDGRHLLLKILAKRGDWAPLGDLARRTLEIQPGDASAADSAKIARDHAPTDTADPAQAASSPAPTPEAYLSQSLVHFQNGRYREALAASDRALQLRPDYAEALNNKCAAYNVLHRYAEARAACERALQLKPDFQLAQNNLAIARTALER
jgi:Flp pilus assembly protein TadD